MMDIKSLRDKVIVAVFTAIILTALALIWNSLSSGGLVKILGGATSAEFKKLQQDFDSIQSSAGISDKKMSSNYEDSYHDAYHSKIKGAECPPGQFVSGLRTWGATAGAVGNLTGIQVFCRPVVPSIK